MDLKGLNQHKDELLARRRIWETYASIGESFGVTKTAIRLALLRWGYKDLTERPYTYGECTQCHKPLTFKWSVVAKRNPAGFGLCYVCSKLKGVHVKREVWTCVGCNRSSEFTGKRLYEVRRLVSPDSASKTYVCKPCFLQKGNTMNVEPHIAEFSIGQPESSEFKVGDFVPSGLVWGLLIKV